MGKQRVAQLLTQLRENQAKDVENAAAIYTVAQVAADALHPVQPSEAAARLPATPTLNKAELLRQYGSFNGCRRAAKEQGIRFRKTPSWAALEAAFVACDACKASMRTYLESNLNQHLTGVSFEISLDDCKAQSSAKKKQKSPGLG